MHEWQDAINPYNSDKILLYREWLEGAASGNFLPPITANIDVSARCNINCKWCIASKSNDNRQEYLPTSHYVDIARFCKEWGVVSNCIGGGGDPFCNKDGVLALINECHTVGISNSVTTNGTLLDDEAIDTVAKKCRWLGVSVDAGTSKTYSELKGCKESLFNTVTENILKARTIADKAKSNIEISYKFLLYPGNIHEIQEACLIAKESGAHQFFMRPFTVYASTTDKDRQELADKRKIINAAIEKCMSHENKNFRVYAVRHKYNFDYKPKFNFSKCRAVFSPVFMANGDFILCPERRGDPTLTLCKHYPDLQEVKKSWGSERHKQLLDAVKFSDCPKCNASKYNEIIEKVFIDDRMCRKHV
jgi:MoaA/NifB/PqqE/SkfB family radical SAM enzyme